jgi:hypothetical protein
MGWVWAKVIHCLIKKDADETGIENEDSNKEPAKDTWIFAIRAAKSIDIEKLF